MPDPTTDKPDLKTHPLVAMLQGDSDTPPSLVTMTGYFGPSKDADSIRMYPSLDFQSYFELSKDAIVATTPLDPEDDQSPTVAYIKAATPVVSVQTTTLPVESYLQGGITGQNLGPILPLIQTTQVSALGASLCCHRKSIQVAPFHPDINLAATINPEFCPTELGCVSHVFCVATAVVKLCPRTRNCR